MRTEQLPYSDEHITASLAISEANVLIGTRRARLKYQASQEIEPDPDKAILRLFTYPDLIAATSGTITLDGNEIAVAPVKVNFDEPPYGLSFETFLTLPDKLVSDWENLVYQLNAHWLPVKADDPKGKGELTPSPADSPSTSPLP